MSTFTRKIRSFVRREGRMTNGQQRAFDRFIPQYGVDFSSEQIVMEQLFGREAPITLEIGFGMGASLAEQARVNPERDFFGIEVHRPGVGALLVKVGEHSLTNVRVSTHDAVEVLAAQIPDASLDKVQLFFPDPWHKKKHHKRRIVQPAFVAELHKKLKNGGLFHMATDWQNYAEHMHEVMENAAGWQNQSATGDYVPQPEDRPVTKFQSRGERLGHGVWDLIYKKVSDNG